MKITNGRVRIRRKHKCALAECLVTVIENLLNVIKSGYILNTNERVTLNDFFIFYKIQNHENTEI